MGTVDSKAQDKANEVKKRYEKKLTAMQKELSKLQNSKKETQRLLKTKVNVFYVVEYRWNVHEI